jgi:hypothetical protein
MKKIFLGIKVLLLIIVGAILGVGIFSFVIAKTLYFPNIKQTVNVSKGGINLTAYQYSPWLWNKEKTTVINIHDWKNNADNFQSVFKDEVSNIRFIHGGEDFALIAYNDLNFSSVDRAFIIHRSPKTESENIIETVFVGGDIIAVAPDESGYFYITSSGNKVFKKNWQDNTEAILEADLPVRIIPIIELEPLFFSNNTKMAFMGTSDLKRDSLLFIWDLIANRIDKISILEKFPEYNKLSIKDDKLYIEKNESIKTDALFVAK